MMRIRTITAVAIALSVAASGSLSAKQIYRWVDDDGNVIYSDMPTENAERVAVSSQPTDPARVQAQAQARHDAAAKRAEDEANAPQGPTADEQREYARERQSECEKYRERQFQFTKSRRIYREDEDGERVYYDEEEMADARAKVDDLVAQNCD